MFLATSIESVGSDKSPYSLPLPLLTSGPAARPPRPPDLLKDQDLQHASPRRPSRHCYCALHIIEMVFHFFNEAHQGAAEGDSSGCIRLRHQSWSLRIITITGHWQCHPSGAPTPQFCEASLSIYYAFHLIPLSSDSDQKNGRKQCFY